MEEIAYTWFNRFIALRFMEVNNYLPSHIRVFTDAEGVFKPEMLAEALHLELPGLDREKVAGFIDNNQADDLYRYLLLTQCNALNEALPRMFERMGSYTELLLPNNILRADGIIGRMIGDIPEEDWTNQVQIIGWLYQYYNAELKEDNLKFIANALGGKGTPREVIRSYFLNDFFSDHLKIYQKRPIYWLFDSGKKNGFKALVYMHRYQSDLLARMRTDYVHEQQERYRTQLRHIEDAMSDASTSERVKLSKQQAKLQEQALELQKYEEKIHHLADQNIQIDLDDGVKHNYALFADVLAKIK